jgi:hypothetical protein
MRPACHCEERSDEAISRRRSPCSGGLLRFARNDSVRAIYGEEETRDAI